MKLRRRRLPVSILVVLLVQHSKGQSCEDDLILLSEFGLAVPDASVGNFCSASTNPSSGAAVYLCDYFGSPDDDGTYQSTCALFGGETIPIVTELSCDSGLESRIMVPWCLPPSCLDEGVEASIGRMDAAAKAADAEGCSSSVARYDLCGGERAKLEARGLTYGFPAPFAADGSLREYCTSAVDYYASPLTSDTRCDSFNSSDVDELLSSCTDSGGAVLAVTKTVVCDIGGFLIDTVALTAPWCVPASCDAYDIYGERLAEETAAAACPIALTSPDLTAAPTSAPSSPPTAPPSPSPTTSSPTAAPSRHPTQAPTAVPSHAPTAKPTSSPTAAPSPSPSHVPSAGPTTAEPTPVPTSPPTEMPTPAPTQFVCIDDPTFRHRDKKKKSCRWIGKKEQRINKLCQKKKVANACKIVCDRCCADDLTRTFPVDGETNQHNCNWLWSESRKTDHCTRQQVNSICAAKCGRCCSNDGDFTFDTGTPADPKPRKCSWFKKPNRARVWCGREPAVADACQKSCRSCKDYTIPITEYPSESPTHIPTKAPLKSPV